jgi:hypothetical protein
MFLASSFILFRMRLSCIRVEVRRRRVMVMAKDT